MKITIARNSMLIDADTEKKHEVISVSLFENGDKKTSHVHIDSDELTKEELDVFNKIKSIIKERAK